MTKASAGNFFEDFRIGQVIDHATPRTVTVGDVALYNGLFGARFAVQSSDAFAQRLGYPRAPVDDLLVFHIVFGKTVPDISLNAVANLGYADCRFLAPVFPGDTLNASVRGDRPEGELEPQDRHRVRALVRQQAGRHQGARICALGDGAKARRGRARAGRPRAAAAGGGHACDARRRLPGARSRRPTTMRSPAAAYRYDDYAVGEKIDHVDGVTVEEAEHQIATRLYQNTARIHFDQFSAAQGRFGRRLIYGGHVISLARALSFNGLANAFHVAGINGGRHVAPLFAGMTVFAWSEVLARAELPGRHDVGALRLRTVATKDRPCPGLPAQGGRQRRSGGAARSRLLGADAALTRAALPYRITPQAMRSPALPAGSVL